MPSLKKSLIVEQFQRNYLNSDHRSNKRSLIIGAKNVDV